MGGDYYDFLEIDDHTMGFALGDVSGKGVPAALLMANLQACFRSQSPGSLLHPANVLKTVNRHFFDSTAAERFATLFFATYDDRTRELRYVNCGHLAPLLLRMSGQLERLGPTATMLGAFREWGCTEASADLLPGDTLVMYSDGVTEAGIEGGHEYGEERLIAKMREHQWEPAGRHGKGHSGRRRAVQPGRARRRCDGGGRAWHLRACAPSGGLPRSPPGRCSPRSMTMRAPAPRSTKPP